MWGEIAETPPREKKHKKKNKKRAEPDPDLPLTRDYGVDEDRDGVLVDDAHNEPTMGDKLSSLKLLGGEKVITEVSAPSDDKPPTAASVNVLLRQALHADDRSLLGPVRLYIWKMHPDGSVRCLIQMFYLDVVQEEEDEGPVIYEDKDSHEEGGAGAEEAMETDEEGDESDDEDADGVNSFEDFDDMSD
ncbi:PREDICTED: uncharacterized protein LOC106308932 [Brassica oleracea var. oleracea]|uniref:uncharacterized protein LOC106308932 n=1 Tax=Brassica oleracea var. oleracea TaxID=109376 RepID=UPI0006A6E0D8|nr:PREDICTED: uncharacterized protein LOC106308932 [Brassica oleracea var. oleracea]